MTNLLGQFSLFKEASSSFLIERDLPFQDSKGNKDFQCLPQFVNSPLLFPFQDENPPSAVRWPNGKKFAVCLSHDVDRVTHFSFSEAYRRLQNLAFLEKTRDKTGLIKNQIWIMLQAARHRTFGRCDPWWSFEKWLELESQYGAHSTFFFFPDSPSRYHLKDCRYKFNDQIRYEGKKTSVQKMMRLLADTGWDIGLHGSYHSFDDANELKSQKAQIENVIGLPIVCNRQHTLHFDLTQSPQAIEQAGFQFDSTPGFNRIVGFRFGTSFPFYYPTPQGQTNLIHIPLNVQDCSLFQKANLDLNEEGAFFYCKLLIDRVAKVRGVITLSWHHGTYNETLFPGWFNVYKRCLEYLHRNHAWMASVKEIGQWCRTNQMVNSPLLK